MKKTPDVQELMARAEAEASALLSDIQAMRGATGHDLADLAGEVRRRADAIKTVATQLASSARKLPHGDESRRRQWRPAGSPGDAEKRDLLRRGAFRIKGHD